VSPRHVPGGAVAVALVIAVALAVPASAATQVTLAPTLKRLTVEPATIRVGATASATVTLRRAPRHDVSVPIASSDEWVALPFADHVTVPAGKRTGGVLIYGFHEGQATITATLGDRVRSAPIAVVP
jgi:hypothetical protein